MSIKSIPWGTVIQSLVLCLFLSSCGNDEVQDLKDTAQDDLKFMVAELQVGAGKASVRPHPYYVVTEFKEVPMDSSFESDKMATIQFYYLKGSSLCQIRKYRHPRMGEGWDRYDKSMSHCDTNQFH